jgi:hypothetical protein
MLIRHRGSVTLLKQLLNITCYPVLPQDYIPLAGTSPYIRDAHFKQLRGPLLYLMYLSVSCIINNIFFHYTNTNISTAKKKKNIPRGLSP